MFMKHIDGIPIAVFADEDGRGWYELQKNLPVIHLKSFMGKTGLL